MAKTPTFSSARLQGAALCLSLALGASTLAQAAPPPGHPSARQSLDILMPNKPESKNLSQSGQVLSTMNANEFTYIEVKRADAVEWIAVPLMEVKPGSTVRYEDGIVMADFYSKLLKRTFPSVRFVGQIEVKAER